jgi:hypothetical protein
MFMVCAFRAKLHPMPYPPNPLPRMDHTGGWKPSQYRHALGLEICARVAEGRTITEICADPAMPSRATLFQWLRRQPYFACVYEAERVERAQAKVARADARRAAVTAAKAARARAAGRRPRDWVCGQKSRYDPAVAERFCDLIALGATLAEACGRPGLPSVKQVYGWLKRRPEFRIEYVKARAFQREVLADQMLAVALDTASAADLEAGIRLTQGRIGRLTPKTWRPGLPADPFEP